jgi:hypothetical protein
LATAFAGAATAGDGAGSTDLSARRAQAVSTSSGCLPGALKAALAKVRNACGRVQVISTFRRGARIAGSGHPSYHASCRAVDFNAPRACAMRVLAGWPGGIGTYHGSMHHIHLDTGPQVRFSHGGGRAKTRHARRGGKRTRRVAARRHGYAVSSARRHRHHHHSRRAKARRHHAHHAHRAHRSR